MPGLRGPVVVSGGTPAGAAGGDLGGSYPNPDANKLHRPDIADGPVGDITITGGSSPGGTGTGSSVVITPGSGGDTNGNTIINDHNGVVRVNVSESTIGIEAVLSAHKGFQAFSPVDGNAVIATATFGPARPALGFYGVPEVERQTGVAVNAAAIHAALVNLGLISA